MTKRTIILIFLVFFLALFARLYLMTIKQGLHSDETFIILNSKNNNIGYLDAFEENKLYSALELKKLAFSSSNDFKSILKSIKRLRTENQDALSPTLYPSLVRLSQLNTKDLDIPTTVNRALYLNLIIFILSFFVMIKILNIIDIDKNFIPLALLIAFFNTGSLSTFLFIKPYILQELAYLLLTYLFVIEIKKLAIEQNSQFSVKESLISVFTLCFAMLSGYFSAIYIFLLSLAYIFYCIKYKQIKNIYKLLLYLLVALGLALLFYPGFFNILYSNTPTDRHSFTVISSIKNLISILSTYLFYFPTTLIFAFCIFNIFTIKNKPKNTILYIIVLFNIVTAYCSLTLGLYNILRYIAPTLAMISLIIPYFISYIEKSIIKNLLVTLTVFIYIFGFIFATTYESYDNDLLSGDEKPFIPNIENTFTRTNCTPVENAEIPIIFFTHQAWPIDNVIPHLKDTQQIMINYTNENIKIKPPKHFIALVYFRKIESPKNYILINKFHCQRFEGFEVKKAE